jgi:hypothetical protein
VNHAIKPFQSVGLQGERDIHKKLLELPIPSYDRKDELHAQLVALAAEAEREATGVVQNAGRSNGMTRHPHLPTSLGGRRMVVRDALSSTLRFIDLRVKELLTVAGD